MVDHGLSLAAYDSTVCSINPLCMGYLDMDSSIFEWNVVSRDDNYPMLDPQRIVTRADGECVSCAIIYTSFQGAGLELRTSHSVQGFGFFKMNESGSLMAIAVLHEEPDVRVELYITPGAICSPWSIINPMTHLSGNTASEAGTQRMKVWIEQCVANHERCSLYSNAPLPTRVIDLGHSNETIKLLETHDVSGPYICLSHCWGESSTILCTRETYDAFTNNILWSSLPALFRDAIEVCRVLKVRYLWIDKLCIIQHDKEDWAREGSRMAKIFEGSFLTIAALSSKHDKDSLFFKDEKHAPSQRLHTVSMKDGTMYTVCSRIPLGYHPADDSHRDSAGEDHPLITRAWVYQERLLAPRILYFGKELSWECREASACECSAIHRGTKYAHSLSLTSTIAASQLHWQWRRMVTYFSRLRLSHESDRLPALSGLAQQFQSRLKSPYLAGLWKDNLEAGLLWLADPPSQHELPYGTRKSVKWRAPSWSWASLEGSVHYLEPDEDHKLTFEIQIISAECIPSSIDKLGAVSDGRLVVKGRRRPALLSHREKCDGTIRSKFTVESQEACVDYDLVEHGLMEPNSDMSIHCLYIAGVAFEKFVYDTSKAEYSHSPAYKMFFLLLRYVNDKAFERIGVLKCDYEHGRETEVQNCLEEDTITIL